MGISTNLQDAPLDDLYLDPKNPRLGRHYANANSSQEEILDVINEWTLDELAISYIENIESGGFWTHEALLVVEEELYGEQRFIVVEGNRRLAALIYLRRAVNGENVSKKRQLLVENLTEDDLKKFEKLFNHVPYIQADSRQDIEAFLGFRHVTGIKQWNPEEKAQYIAWLIDERGMTYEEVMRKIGSKTRTVRENYISYQLLLQIEVDVEDFSPKYAEDRFSVMYLTLKKHGVQKYLQIDLKADPETAKRPVPEDHLKNLENFALWLFGNDKQPSLFEDSRQANQFDTILKSEEAVQYLELAENPRFDYALQLAGGDELETIELINKAAYSIRLSLSHVHHHKDSQEMQRAVKRLTIDFKELLDRFPSLRTEFLEDD
jgi:hypothetical protein